MTTKFPHSDSSAVAPAAASAPAMAAQAPPKDSNKLDISNLMSPPENLLETFHQGHGRRQSKTVSAMSAAVATVSANNGRLASDKHPLPMSPPISPYTKSVSSSSSSSGGSSNSGNNNNVNINNNHNNHNNHNNNNNNHNNTPSTPPSQAIQDPVLYPADESSPSSPPQPPLFAPAEVENHKRIVDDHVRARSSSTIIFSGVSPPRREDYELALTFRSQVMKHFTSNRRGWLLKERALLVADRQAGAQRFHAILPAKPIAAKAARSHRGDRVSKPQTSAPRPIRSSVNGLPSSTVIVRPATGRRPSATPEPSRRIVAPNREDKDFRSLPDYCPPLDSLPTRANSLKVDWKGQPIDLSSDPYHHLLHPDEIILAGNLRLDCATYLTSKRRMFERRLQCLRTGKEFRKTDAQQACKIDVNKASKLWTAFDKVGWLNAEWVRHLL
ncbi:hypothetical protein V8C37DRAFT_412839 [Trichoderma ceciliae]